MKKPIALLAALTIAFCSFAACSEKNNSSSSSESSAPAPHTISVAFDREKAETVSREVVTTYFNDINSGDIAASMKYQYDDDMLVAAAVMSGLTEKDDTPGEAVDKMISAFADSYKGHTITLNELVSIDRIPEEGYVLLDESYGRLIELKKIIDKYKNKLDPDEISEKYKEITDVSGYRREYEEGYDAVFSVTVDDETKEQEMLIYRPVGSDWQIDMTVPSYLQQKEKADMDNTASATSATASDVLKEMAAKGKDISGTFIISKDSSKDYKVPDTFDINTFRSMFAEKYSGDDDADYFMVIDDSIAVYGVYQTADKQTGIYPFGLMIKDDGSDKLTYSELDADQTYDIDQLYDMAKEILG